MAKVDLSGLDLEGLNSLIEDATKLRDQKVEEKRAELMKQLQALDAIGKPTKAGTSRRASPPALYRGPQGEEWSGRGGIPRWARDLGATSKEDMQKYLIRS